MSKVTGARSRKACSMCSHFCLGKVKVQGRGVCVFHLSGCAQINIFIPLHCVFRVFVISSCIVKSAQVNICIIKAFLAFGFISIGEAAGEGEFCVAKRLSRGVASHHLGLLSGSR